MMRKEGNLMEKSVDQQWDKTPGVHFASAESSLSDIDNHILRTTKKNKLAKLRRCKNAFLKNAFFLESKMFPMKQDTFDPGQQLQKQTFEALLRCLHTYRVSESFLFE